MPENELLKKLEQIRKEVIQPVLGDAEIRPDQIVDFRIMNSYSGRSKVGVIYMDGEGLKEVMIGAIHLNKLEECIKKNKTISIKRKINNNVPQTEITC
jgi:hypothetical protein